VNLTISPISQVHDPATPYSGKLFIELGVDVHAFNQGNVKQGIAAIAATLAAFDQFTHLCLEFGKDCVDFGNNGLVPFKIIRKIKCHYSCSSSGAMLKDRQWPFDAHLVKSRIVAVNRAKAEKWANMARK